MPIADPDAARPPAPRRPSLWPRVIAVLLGLLAIAVPIILIATASERPAPPTRAPVRLPTRVVPAAEVPRVEPIELQDVPPQDARAFNATVPFSTKPNPAARPFRLTGSVADQARAVDCLATAVLYEAGDDRPGQQAVAQVVLNRVRHPAFPKSVCGVVFQGEERRTGCQFSFTCDGALARVQPAGAWTRARIVARAALTGAVFRAVGHATHYHTDWVVPYWSSSLDKITELHTHLFFRWTGWWGTPAAFGRAYAGTEPLVSKLAGLSDAHKLAGQAKPSPDDGAAGGLVADATTPGRADDAGEFMVKLDRNTSPDALLALAMLACGDRGRCAYLGWTDPAMRAASLPLTAEQTAALSFSYQRDRDRLIDKAQWNCSDYRGISPLQCLPRPKRATPPGEETGTPTRPREDTPRLLAD